VALRVTGKVCVALSGRRSHRRACAQRPGRRGEASTDAVAAPANSLDSASVDIETWTRHHSALWQVLVGEFGFTDAKARALFKRSFHEYRNRGSYRRVRAEADLLRDRLLGFQDIFSPYGAPLAKIVSGCPSIIDCLPRSLDQKLASLRSKLGISFAPLGLMVGRSPNILNVPVETAAQIFDMLQDQFGDRKAADMLIRYPQIIGYCSPTRLKANLDAVVQLCAPGMDHAHALNLIWRRPKLMVVSGIPEAVTIGAKSTGLPYNVVCHSRADASYGCFCCKAISEIHAVLSVTICIKRCPRVICRCWT
jgi:mTERF